MNHKFKRLFVTIVAFCLCLSLLPVNAEAAKALKITASSKVAGGGDFLKGVSKLTVNFKINQSKSVTVSVIDDEDSVVFKKEFKNCAINKSYSFEWDGKNSKGKYVEGGTYYPVITVGKEKKELDGVDFYDSSDFSGGNGSKKNPYLVSSVEEFTAIPLHNGLYFKQTKNLDFSDIKFNPLFTKDNGFSGTYNGNGKTISNIEYSSEAEYIGLFRALTDKGVVKNVTVKDCSFSGNKYCAAIIGYNCGNITDCKVTGTTVTASDEWGAVIAGFNSNGTINGCVSKENIIKSSFNGGIIAAESSGNIKKCTSTEDVIVAGKYAGGIAGYNTGNIDSCKVTDSAINSTSRNYTSKAGGIAGYSNGIIKKCIVNDTQNLITAPNNKGGIAGSNDGTLIGNTYYGELKEVG